MSITDKIWEEVGNSGMFICRSMLPLEMMLTIRHFLYNGLTVNIIYLS